MKPLTARPARPSSATASAPPRDTALETALDALDAAIAGWVVRPPSSARLEREFSLAIGRVLRHARALDYAYVGARIRFTVDRLFDTGDESDAVRH